MFKYIHPGKTKKTIHNVLIPFLYYAYVTFRDNNKPTIQVYTSQHCAKFEINICIKLACTIPIQSWSVQQLCTMVGATSVISTQGSGNTVTSMSVTGKRKISSILYKTMYT